MGFPVEYSNRPSNTITSLPQRAYQSGYNDSHYEGTPVDFSIRARRTLMQRSRYTHPCLLNGESVPQNVPGSNPQASLRAAWEHTNTIIPEQQGVQAWDRYAYVNNSPLNYSDPTGHYDKEVHRDMTYQLVHDAAMNIADEIGLGFKEIKAFADYLASEVARGDMAADSMNTDGTINLDYIYNEPLSPPMYIPIGNGNEGSIWVERKAPHWYTTPEAIADIKDANNPFEFGIASHKYQDSFAHWQKLGQPNTSLGIWAAHALNNPYKLIDPTQSVDYFKPGTATKDRRIDSAMVNGYTSLVDGFVRTQINHWSYDGR